eukprot:PhM_4_TR14137/c0_g1_i1/m.36849/K01230/MAN1; mannosyl-oligosaccharide alpha-1,2-mannosidase
MHSSASARSPWAIAVYLLAGMVIVVTGIVIVTNPNSHALTQRAIEAHASAESSVRRVEALSGSLSALVLEIASLQSRVMSAHDAAPPPVPPQQHASIDAIYTKPIMDAATSLKAEVDAVRAKTTEQFTELKKIVKARQDQEQQYDDSGEGDDGGEVGPSPAPTPDPYASLTSAERTVKRREEVKTEFMHSWKAYKKFAWGMDEYTPLSQHYKNWARRGGGLGLTILDAMSTIWIMGLKDEFEACVKWVKEKLNPNKDVRVSAFESTIRIVGGLLSAYELSGETEPALLDKARDVADRLLWAYNTTSGIPHAQVNLKSHRHGNPGWTGSSSVLSEFGTVQLEFRTLSFHTKNPVYDMKATHIMNIIDGRAPKDWLCPTYLSLTSLRWTSDHVSLGALGDSFFEYLLKQYLLTGKTEKRYREMFIKAADGVIAKLVHKTEPSGWVYVAEWKHGGVYPKMDELACFTGGMFALAAHELDLDPKRKKKYLEVGAGITHTCHMMWARQKTGIAPEIVQFFGNDFENGATYYLLRPETMESFFYLWRITKDEKYRQYGWEAFAAIKKWCRVESGGYSGLKSVARLPPRKDDLMQSFWLAETLKYAYMLFSDDDALDLSQWVINTEAHPLKIRSRDPMDVLIEYEKEHGDLPWKPPTLPGVEIIETPKQFKARGGKKVKKLPEMAPAMDEPEGDDGGGDLDMDYGGE